MATQRFCDFKDCNAAIHSEGFHGKAKKGRGRLAGRDLDLCPDHRERLEDLILGPQPDKAQDHPKPKRSA